ncbi:hypothetical protein L7F22_009835 [Adiantum nelumboides]|nr:hypothetical protein [Adiantum nelumboides]
MGSLQEEEVSSSAARSNRLSRLEHILGGKSRKGLMRLDEGADDGKIEKETKSLNCNERGDVDEPMLEASTNSCVSDFVQCEDLGLEIAMKQLMEATHDALVNMKGEILRMQYDLERALVEISLLQQREELFQQQFKGKAFELENELSKRLEDLRQTILLEFTMCKHESEQRMIGKLESLLDEMRDIQKQCGKGEMIDPLRDKKFIVEHPEDRAEKSGESGHSSINEISKAKVDDLQQRSHQRAALTEEMLQRISPKRFEQSVAVVRGWLQSPTPSEVSSAPAAEPKGKGYHAKQQRLCNVPMPNLVSSVKEEARLSAAHRRAHTPPHPRVPELPIECEGLQANLHPHHTAESVTDVASERCLMSTTPSEDRPHLQPLIKKAQYKENAIHEYQAPLKPFSLAAFPHQKKHALPSRPEQQITPEGRPALRILKPKNFKISDLLVSDSEDELASTRLNR